MLTTHHRCARVAWMAALLLVGCVEETEPPVTPSEPVLFLVDEIAFPAPVHERIEVPLTAERLTLSGGLAPHAGERGVDALWVRATGQASSGDGLLRPTGPVLSVDLGDVLEGRRREVVGLRLELHHQPVASDLHLWMDLRAAEPTPPSHRDLVTATASARRALLLPSRSQVVEYPLDGEVDLDADTLHLELPPWVEPGLRVGIGRLAVVTQRRGHASTERVQIGSQARQALVVEPGTWLEVPCRIGEGSVLALGVGVVAPPDVDPDAVGVFRVLLRPDQGAPFPLLEVERQLGDPVEDLRVELGEHAGITGSLELGFWSEGEQLRGAWAHPVLFDAQPGARSLLLYVAGALRADSLDALGQSRIGVFARGAVSFESCVAPATWARPSLASILSSTSVFTHGVWSADTAVSDRLTLISEVFAEHGYLTAAFADSPHLGIPANLHQGYDVVELGQAGALSFLEAYAGAPLFLTVHAGAAVDPVHAPGQQGELLGKAWLVRDEVQGTERELREAYASVGASTASPGQLVRATWERGAVDPARLDRLLAESRQRYAERTARADRDFGALLDHLDGLELAERFAVVFTADHGEALFEHGQVGHGLVPYYDSQVHVPLIMSVPWDEAWSGGRVPCTVSSLDILPTALAWHDLPELDQAEGHGLAPLLGGACASGVRDPVYSVGHLPGAELAPGAVTVHEGHQEFLLVAGRGGRLDLWRAFDLAADPAEASELVLAPEHELRIERLAEGFRTERSRRGLSTGEVVRALRPGPEVLREQRVLETLLGASDPPEPGLAADVYSASWSATPLAAGRYEVLVWFPVEGVGAREAVFTVETADGIVAVRSDFRGGSGEWMSLGRHRFEDGRAARIRAFTRLAEGSVAGAVKLEWRGE